MSAAAIRITGWLAVLLVVIMSLVPGNLRPHVLPNNYEEHCLAYVVVSYLLAMANPTIGRRVALGVMLAIGAGLLEIAQLFIVGRTASVADFAAGVLGACIGLTLRW
jgi:VanZ family protein